jgi:hypothetical protein
VTDDTKKWLVQERADNGLYKDVISTDDAKEASQAFIGDKSRRVLDNSIKDYAADYTLKYDAATGETKLAADYHKRSSFAQESGVARPARTDDGKIVEAVASAAVAARVQNPAVREKVMQEVNRQLDKRTAEGRVPPVQVYDAKAPAKPHDQSRVAQADKDRSR